jgi:flagellar protein FlgJ
VSGINPVGPAAARGAVDPALKKVAEQFEAIFLRQMIGTMRQAKLADDIFGSSATDQFRELADARTADSLASLGQFGIAKMIERQLGGKGSAK